MPDDVRFLRSRRRWLQMCGLGFGGIGLPGLTLPNLLAADEARGAAAPRPRADACIIIFLNGGPSHLDMWDMKPAAPDGIRGEFKPIESSLSGVQVCEHLPRLAKHMHRATLVRSMHHGVNNSHASAVYTSMTGHDRGEGQGLVGAGQNDHPTPGAALAKLRGSVGDRVSHVSLPYMTKEGAKGPPQPGFSGGFLGQSFDPLYILNDPNAPTFSVPELTPADGVTTGRLTDRRQLLDAIRRSFDARGEQAFDEMSSMRRKAFELLTSPAAREALNIAAEPEKVREAYGRNIYGQSVLLARRLIEAGTRTATISWAPDANATWDTHAANFTKLKNELLPQFDRSIGALLSDLADRGLSERTIVAVLGDFGRTPKINKNAGRDHWNYCYSVLFAGGGFRPGTVFGASDVTGAFPSRNPLHPGDVIATLYHLLGLAPNRILADQLGRPHRLVPTGDVVPDLIA